MRLSADSLSSGTWIMPPQILGLKSLGFERKIASKSRSAFVGADLA